ncbi:uncharacterized protein LOC108859865 [Raphanus sativus]|uniref:Uncharacterized protein LOC108859865 n=1 Tax=Raphanus sativus TaxID=3726 RepID=A0A6J0NYB7_RAPSA|nr:uncharacterized protein LOC108859865 [Raphanus sativus]
MELAKEKEKKDPKEVKRNGKMKSVALIPDNYVSILQLQERWNKDKERKQKGINIVERGVKEKVNEQGRREEDATEEPRVKIEKDGVEISAIVSKKNEDGGDLKERKKKWSKKKKVNKKNQSGSVNNPVKEETPGEKIVHNRENAASVDTQFQHRVEEEEGRDRGVNVHVRQGYYRNQKHDWSSTRVIKATRTMVWVKKGESDAAAGGGGNGV